MFLQSKTEQRSHLLCGKMEGLGFISKLLLCILSMQRKGTNFWYVIQERILLVWDNHLSDTAAIFSNQESVVLWFGFDFYSESWCLLSKWRRLFWNLKVYFYTMKSCYFFKVHINHWIIQWIRRHTFSLAISRSWALAFSTSLMGPRIVTLSWVEPSWGKRMITPPFSSIMERISLPLDPMMELWNLWGMSTVISLMLALK